MRQEIGRKLVAVRTLLFQEEQVLLVGHRSRRTGTEWWMAPGGLVNHGEPAIDAAIREVKEETGLNVRVKGLVYWLEWLWEQSVCLELYFLGRLTGGSLVVGHDPELDEGQQLIFDARFFPLDELQEFPVYPRAFRTMLLDHWRQGFPTGAKYLGLEKPDLRR